MSRVDNALLLRDTIQKIVDDKISKTNPGASYATVTGFNPALGIITVRYPGDDVDIEIPAGSIYPSEVGQIVRIDGPPGARVVADVKGENLTEVKARDAQETADGKNTVHYGEEEPEGTDHKEGDLWFDEANSNMPHTWINGQWVSIEDLRVAAIAEAQEELKQELDTVVENGVGTKTFYKPTQPTAAESSEGDLWFDTSEGGNNELHTYVNGQWVSAADARIAAIQQAQAELASDLEDVVTNGLGTKTFYKPTQPAVADSKEGDLWFDTSTAGKNALHVFTGGAWVSAADARLAELKAAQAEMEGDISAAQQKADEAFQDAADADSKAATAQSTANTAKSDAAAAAGIAGGKADVLIQSTTPATDMRKATTLWIDTTGSANTPKRWNGTAWVVVTDKAATDAASAAATAQTKANEAKSAADAAQTTATNAQTAASNAQSTATEALTSANSKNTVTRSTANPTTPYTGRVDDIWWKMSTLASGGRVIAQYRWSGTAWLTETIDNAVIANLDAAKITTGYLAAARIQANTLNADTVLINGSLGSIILRDGAITTPKIAVGAITAESGVVASLDAGKITVGILDVARLGANSITADKVLLGSGGNLIPSPDFKTGWSGSYPVSTSGGVSDSPFMTITEGSGQRGAYLGLSDLPHRQIVEPGAMYRVRAWVRSPSEIAPGNAAIYVRAYTPTGSAYTWSSPNGASNTSTIPANTWTIVEGLVTMPADRSRAVMGVYKQSAHGTASMDWCLPSLTAVAGSTLIEPGAITTEKIATGAITVQSGIIASLDAGKITVGTLAAARFAANTINADSVLINSSIGSTLIKDGAITTAKLAVGAITAESGVIASLDASKITVGKLSGARLEADAINGMQIIGATIATSTGFPRVQLDNTGLAVYKSSAVRSFFADAATGDLSIIGKLFTGTEGASRVALDPTLWSSLPVYDGAGGIAGYASGAGIRVGVNASNSADLYHAALSNGATAGVFRSSSGKSVVSVEDMPLRGGRSLSSVEIFGEVSEGKTYARFGDGIYATYNDKADSSYSSRFSIYKNSSGLDTYSGDYSSSVNAGSSFARLSVSKNDNEFYSSVNAGSSSIDLFTSYNPRGSAVTVQLVNGTSTTDGYVNIAAENVNPLRIDYLGTGASWIVPFRKSGTAWGYIGSSGAMGVNDFGIQSASGKDLYLAVTSSNSQIKANSIVSDSGWVTVSPTSPARYYSSSESDKFKVRRINGVVHFTGTGGATSPTGTITLCTLPAGYRPSSGTSFSAMMQGSGQNTWQLTISDTGVVNMGRYGPSSGGTNTWLPFSATFMTDTP